MVNGELSIVNSSTSKVFCYYYAYHLKPINFYRRFHLHIFTLTHFRIAAAGGLIAVLSSAAISARLSLQR